MSSKERRISPRKSCTIPVRFRFSAGGNEFIPASLGTATLHGSGSHVRGTEQRPNAQEIIVGETVNLSERGIRFKSPLKFSIGESIEMFFTLPRELTGRNPEEMRCSARVVHVESELDAQGMTRIGAAVESFEPMNIRRNWSN
jgi:hypothetical protein